MGCKSSKEKYTVQDYKITRKIHKGSFSNVYLATYPDGKKVVIKKSITKMSEQEYEKLCKTLREETALYDSFRHPFVLTVHEIFYEQKNSAFSIAMEYAKKGSLREILDIMSKKG